MRVSRLTFSALLLLAFNTAACDSEEMGSDTTASTSGQPETTGGSTGGPMTTTMAMTSSSTTEPGTTTDAEESSTSDAAGSSDSSSTGEAQETASGSERFEDVVTESGMQALLDLQTDLLWVNDLNACNPLGAPNMDTPMVAMDYCNGLMFAGFDDWRMPMTSEASELITAALEEGVDLIYQNPACPAVITMGGSAVQTHNGDMPGEVIDMPPSLGVRCVRASD